MDCMGCLDRAKAYKTSCPSYSLKLSVEAEI